MTNLQSLPHGFGHHLRLSKRGKCENRYRKYRGKCEIISHFIGENMKL